MSELVARSYGEHGPPLVVVHGGPGAPGGAAALARELGETTRVLELMQATLAPLGLAVEIRELDAGAIQTARQNGDHNIAHLTWIFKDAGFLRTLFHSENIGTGWNFTHRPDADLDAMLEAIETEADPAARAQLVADVQRYAMDQALVIPTVYQEAVTAFVSGVMDPELYPVYGEAPYFYDTWME